MFSTTSSQSSEIETTVVSSPIRPPAPRLSGLKPVDVKPEYTSCWTEEDLMNIEHLAITKVDGQEGVLAKDQRYIVHVYLGKSSNGKNNSVPVVGTAKGLMESREPDLMLIHSVSQFCSLRNSVHSCVQSGHLGSRCTFCQQLGRFVSYGDGRPLPFANLAFTVSQNASTLLGEFMNQVLYQAQLALAARRIDSCRGEHLLPRLLHAFIFRSPRH